MTDRPADAPPPIRVLPAVVADQIAAGEVVTRPASVVKELVDNAIDAQAARITVEIAAGGTTLVAVTDDGHGMDEADARLCILRHATSKIRSADDLLAIRSLGFRGEALPAIASVSRLRLRTRRAETAEGTEVVLEGGELQRVAPCGCARGCTVEVRDLFFNVPARRKFLRALSTESAQISEQLVDAALGRPELGITLVRDGRTARRFTPCPTRRERVMDVLGEGPWIHAEGERGPLRVEAFLGRPERARAGASGLHFVVNGRAVGDRLLARAIASAFGETLDRGRYPIGVVFVELAADLVDVNVHPQKAEVRFAHARAVTDAVHSVVRPAVVAALGLSGAPSMPSAMLPHPRPGQPLRIAEQVATTEPWRWEGSGERGTNRAPSPSASRPGGEQPAAPRRVDEPEARAGAYHAVDGASGPEEHGAPRLIGTLRNGLLVFETNERLAVVDPVAARRALLAATLEQQPRPLESAPLLFPVVREMRSPLAERVERWASALGAYGLELRRSSGASVSLLAVPAAVMVTDAASLLDALVGWIDGQLAPSPPAGDADAPAPWLAGLAAILARHARLEPGDLDDGRTALELLRVALTAPTAEPAGLVCSIPSVELRPRAERSE